MSENPIEVYRSNHSDVLAAWRDYEERYAAWADQVRAFCKKHSGVYEAWHSNGLGREYFDGLVAPEGGPNEGWRVERRHGMMVPDKRTPEGKAFAKEMAPLRHSPLLTLTGMPESVRGEATESGGFRRHSYGAELVGDALEVTWGAKVPPEQVDFEVWEKVPLSQWHAEREAVQS